MNKEKDKATPREMAYEYKDTTRKENKQAYPYELRASLHILKDYVGEDARREMINNMERRIV